MRFNMKNAGRLFLLLICIFMISGCGYIQTKVINFTFYRTMDDLVKVLLEEYNEQHIREAVGADVMLIKLITELSPDNFELLSTTSFLLASYGVYIEDEEPEFAKTLYDDGKEYGLRALSKDKNFRKGLAKGVKIHKLVPPLKKKQWAEALMWTSMNMGLKVMLDPQDYVELMNMADIIAMVEKSLEINENYRFGLGKAFMAAYYSFMPPMLGLGGGAESGKLWFDKAFAVTEGRCLLVHAFKARYYATLIKDEALFDELLKHVLETPADVLPDGAIFNALAKRKARAFIAKKSTWFLM